MNALAILAALTFESSNPALLPVENIVLEPSGALTLTLLPESSGSVIVRLFQDGIPVPPPWGNSDVPPEPPPLPVPASERWQSEGTPVLFSFEVQAPFWYYGTRLAVRWPTEPGFEYALLYADEVFGPWAPWSIHTGDGSEHEEIFNVTHYVFPWGGNPPDLPAQFFKLFKVTATQSLAPF